jgi:hypothetical protein
MSAIVIISPKNDSGHDADRILTVYAILGSGNHEGSKSTPKARLVSDSQVMAGEQIGKHLSRMGRAFTWAFKFDPATVGGSLPTGDVVTLYVAETVNRGGTNVTTDIDSIRIHIN